MEREEAIEIARKLYNESLFLMKKDKEAIVTLIPELAESEDERIKKEIIAYFKSDWAKEEGITRPDWIAWLEKQGEQKLINKVEPKFKIKYAGRGYNVLEVKDIAGVTFYGIEDEPNHIDYVKAENCEKVCGYNIKEKGSPYPTKPAVFSEQNPAWSEEDKKMISDIATYLNRYGNYILNKNEEKAAEIHKAADWIKSLKDKVYI